MSDTNTSELRSKVIHYYSALDRSYRHWGNQGAYELHYGFFDQGFFDQGSFGQGSFGQGASDRVSSGPMEPAEHGAALTRMNERVADAAAVGARDRVLDAGCGVGASAIWLSNQRGCRVHGISLSPSQIGQARHFASHYANRPQDLEFSVADFTAVPAPSGSFDVVWGIESICYAQDKELFLKEAGRLLKPGGRLVVADYFLVDRPHTEIERHSLERWLSGWVIPQLSTEGQFLEALTGSGFGAVQNSDITEHVRPSAEEIFRRGKEGFPDDILTQGKTVVQIRHVEACLFQKVCLDLGLWRYRLMVAERLP